MRDIKTMKEFLEAAQAVVEGRGMVHKVWVNPGRDIHFVAETFGSFGKITLHYERFANGDFKFRASVDIKWGYDGGNTAVLRKQAGTLCSVADIIDTWENFNETTA
jgi:hypothetical protein